MVLEGRASYLVRIFRGHCEHDPPSPQVQSKTLDSKVRFTYRIALCDFDALQPVVPNHAAPNSIVQVENQDFSALAANCGKHPSNVIAVKRNEFIRKWELGQIP